ncbi:TerC family protein [Thermus filiformis]|uniref:Membrane protein n=1 Tax=Thermus filiformis TaxID=276 RepID=A0A0A2XC36_THEFI|nr:membrane protein [Thermus filiformis]KGQ22719.1 membrane protein [Thermus filiformis]
MGFSEAFTVILILVVLEVILSADNALILGILVQKLPVSLRRKALFYGILGAYLLRGLALFFAAYMIQFWWVQALGAAYLLYIALRHFLRPEEAHAPPPLEVSSAQFWKVVAQVELADLAFAVDSVLVAVALSDKLWVVYTGVFLGILALRMLASLVVGLLDRYPRFKHLAYGVVGLAGVKLAVGGWDKLVKEVLHRPELALGLDKEAFSLFILAVLLLGSLWATREPKTA